MENTTPPPFHSSITTVDPTVKAILSENELFIEHGVSFAKYVPLKPNDNMGLVRDSKLLCYYYKDANCFLNTKRIFLEIEFHCENDDSSALTQANNVSACNVMSHSIIDSALLNIGKYKVEQK